MSEEQKKQKVIKIWSGTHYGRGEPLPGKEVEFRIRLCKHLMDWLVPGLPVYRTCDEDYGWIVPLTGEQVDALLERFPLSMREDDYIYLHDWGMYEDVLMVEFEGDDRHCHVAISDAFGHELTHDLSKPPVDREKLWQDWYDNYGRY